MLGPDRPEFMVFVPTDRCRGTRILGCCLCRRAEAACTLTGEAAMAATCRQALQDLAARTVPAS